jgi:hypothetical protein
MIAKIKIKNGVLHDLMNNKTIKFDPGMNIIWGRNGVGKSLLLKTIGNYCFVNQTHGGGWSDTLIWFKFSNYDFEYKTKDKNLSNVYEFDKNSKIDIEWSGDPCFYMHHDDMIDWTHIMGYEMGGGTQWINGIGKISETVLKKHQYHPSTGQQIKGIAEMLLKVQPPDLMNLGDRFSACHDIAEYVKKRKESFTGELKPTLLLDEIDSQLDLFNQMWFHKEVIPQLLEKFQIIMVSHSIFAATYHKNIIELDNSLGLIKKELNIL